MHRSVCAVIGCTLALDYYLVSRARPTSAKKGKGLVNYVYKPCLATLYSAVQSHCSILSHGALHHCLNSNSSLENHEQELGHLFHYSRSCKNTSTTLVRECAYSTIKSVSFEISYYIKDPSLFYGSGSGS